MKTILICLLGLGLWLPNRAPSLARETGMPYRCSPVMLNGQSMISATLPLGSRGVVGLVTGDPCSAAHKPTAFRAYLRRAGTVIQQGASNENQTVFFVRLDDLMPHARLNDELVIEPASVGSQQVIRIMNMEPIDWFRNVRSKDGC